MFHDYKKEFLSFSRKKYLMKKRLNYENVTRFLFFSQNNKIKIKTKEIVLKKIKPLQTLWPTLFISNLPIYFP